VLFIGVSYKLGLSDVRESQALQLMKLVKNMGGEVYWHDSYVDSLDEYPKHQSKNEYNLCVLMQDHKEYLEISNKFEKVYKIA
jgi:UDP-N-acetyl-D-mannosaminuronate dehydrogenase